MFLLVGLSGCGPSCGSWGEFWWFCLGVCDGGGFWLGSVVCCLRLFTICC